MRSRQSLWGEVVSFSGKMPSGVERLETRLSLTLLLMWMLPALLTAIQGESAVRSFLSDSALHTRSLIAVPLLLVGKYVSVPLLQEIASHFRDLIPDEERDCFDRCIRLVRFHGFHTDAKRYRYFLIRFRRTSS